MEEWRYISIHSYPRHWLDFTTAERAPVTPRVRASVGHRGGFEAARKTELPAVRDSKPDPSVVQSVP
jgi:hypothetical protein